MRPFFTALILFLALSLQAQIINIPSTVFKSQLLPLYDTNHDGEIDMTEALEIRDLSIGCYLVPGGAGGGSFYSAPVADLTGIEHFVNLERLALTGTCAGGGGVVSANFSGLEKMRYLNIFDAIQLRRVNLTGCIGLDSLILGGVINGFGSNLDTLDLNSCTGLRYLNLYCHDVFRKLIIDSCINLKEIYMSVMLGDGFNIHHLLNLETFSILDAFSHINLNCSGLTRLKTVDVTTGDLTGIQFTGCTNLETVFVSCSNIPSPYIDFSNSPQLADLVLFTYDSSNLRSLNVKNGTAFTRFIVAGQRNLEQVCADDFEVDTLQQYFDDINQTVDVTASCSFSPVPIKLERFFAFKKENVTHLDWKANCTYGNATFVMERSDDGIHFTAIGNINATSLRCQLPFNFTDNNPVAGKNYYRLKITDADGKSFYSKTLVVGNNKAGLEITAVANNTVYLNSNKQQTITMKIVAVDGREILNQKHTISAGNNNIDLQVKNSAKGIYTLIVYSEEGEMITRRFIK